MSHLMCLIGWSRTCSVLLSGIYDIKPAKPTKWLRWWFTSISSCILMEICHGDGFHITDPLLGKIPLMFSLLVATTNFWMNNRLPVIWKTSTPDDVTVVICCEIGDKIRKRQETIKTFFFSTQTTNNTYKEFSTWFTLDPSLLSISCRITWRALGVNDSSNAYKATLGKN